MRWKIIATVFAIILISALVFFYFVPLKTIDFGTSSGNGNFSAFSEGSSDMQFYSNMRFPENIITYRISECPLQKQNDMQMAFGILEDSTSLRFYSVENNEQISITCEEKERPSEGNLFIAGEGGPTNITAIGDFAVILHGEILLIRESKCATPNIALHELLHVLGFQHSTNPENIMYSITDCDQTIGDDIIELINALYAVPSYADIAFGNVSAEMNGRFLNVDIAVINAGLKESGDFQLKIYADEEIVKEVSMEPIDIGYGRAISLRNVWVSDLDVDELKIVAESEFNEITKTNNEITLQVS